MIKKYTLVIVSDNTNFGEVLKIANKEKVEILEGPSTMLLILNKLNENKKISFTYPKYIGFGGSKVSESVLKNLLKLYPDKEFWLGYGMTEYSPLIAKPYKHLDRNRLPSVGTAVKDCKIVISDGKKHFKTPYRTGEILIKGPGLMLGYYKNKKENILENGYFKTGDIGYLDEKSYLYICGRKKNIIIVRGYNVFIEEVEEILLNSGFVNDCKVFGEKLGEDEIVCADIIPKSSEISVESINSYLKNVLAEYKIPKKWSFVSKIQKTSSGKTIRRKYGK